jgi:hypothetical protein
MAQAKKNKPLRLWSQVEKTNPANTKNVPTRGGFTAIDAMHQTQIATEVFGGPMGIGWGFGWTREDSPPDLFLIRGRLWYTDEATGEVGAVEQYGAANWGSRVDSDTPKKAVTDAFTKCLSLLGFNADVFLGKFDDNKYVADLNKEFGNTPTPKAKKTDAPKRANGSSGTLTKPERELVAKAAKERGIELKLPPGDFNGIGSSAVEAMGFKRAKEVPSDKLNTLLSVIQGWKPDMPEVPF